MGTEHTSPHPIRVLDNAEGQGRSPRPKTIVAHIMAISVQILIVK